MNQLTFRGYIVIVLYDLEAPMAISLLAEAIRKRVEELTRSARDLYEGPRPKGLMGLNQTPQALRMFFESYASMSSVSSLTKTTRYYQVNSFKFSKSS